MKKVTKFFMAALLAGICSLGYGQDYLGAPKVTEKVIGTVTSDKVLKRGYDNYVNAPDGNSLDWYNTLMEKAKKEYPNRDVDIRNIDLGVYCCEYRGASYYRGPAVGKVVVDFGELINGSLSQALSKALRNVREGSRMAIDQVSVTYGMDKEVLKDQLLDVLLDKGYKVIAKEYLEKLYEEQEAQQSGIYNESTTVKDNNFSAVGYYINVKVTETSLRVQVVNVSTGEYEGNATVNF